jgi:hypothetical protein
MATVEIFSRSLICEILALATEIGLISCVAQGEE